MARFKWGDVLKTGAKVVLENLEDRAREGEPKQGSSGGPSGVRRPDPDPPPPPPEIPEGPAPGQDLDILVAPRGSEALARAEELEDGGSVLAERKLWKAFDRAAEHLSSQGPCTVTIRLAAGAYPGRMRTGTWKIPKIDAPASSLHVLGGYDGAFVRRAPFTDRSELVVAEDRTAPVLQFERNSRLDRFVLSGLCIDCGPSNVYGDGDNLMTGQTGSYEMIAFSYLEVETLVIADNLLANAGHRVAETLIRAASDDAEIVVRNNVLINNVMAWRAFSAKFRHQPARYRFLHNSFLLNWPNNPDRSTSNPGALELGDRHSAGAVEIRGNLFAFNAGGAIHAGFEGDLAPTMAVHDNLFWGNGTLFELDEPGLAAVVGKFNRSRRYIPLHPDDFEDELEWDAGGNVVLDPRLRVQIRPFRGFDSAHRADEVGDEAGGPAPGDAIGDSDDLGLPAATEPLADSKSLLDDDVAAGGSLDDLDEGFDLSLGDAFEDEAEDEGEDVSLDALDDDLGDFPDLDGDLDDGFHDLGWDSSGMETFHAEGFASRIYLDAPELPFPREASAEAYGASPDRVDRDE